MATLTYTPIHTHYPAITNARVEALFASPLSRLDTPAPAVVTNAVTTMIKEFGSRGCAAAVAQAYGDCIETYLIRMQWAISTINRVYGP